MMVIMMIFKKINIDMKKEIEIEEKNHTGKKERKEDCEILPVSVGLISAGLKRNTQTKDRGATIVESLFCRAAKIKPRGLNSRDV